VIRDISLLCGTISCVEIANDSHSKTLDVFSYLQPPDDLLKNVSDVSGPLFTYEGNMTVQDTRTIPCMIYNPMETISLRQVSGVR
jgi:hypothetical protein